MAATERIEVPAARRRRRTSFLKWVGVGFVLLAAFGYFVVKPVAEKALQGAVAAVGGLLTVVGQIATFVGILYDDACQRVAQSPRAKDLFGEPIQCASLEDVEWLDATAHNALEFRFQVSGPDGTGEAHAIAVTTDDGLELTRLEVTGPDGRVVLVPLP